MRPRIHDQGGPDDGRWASPGSAATLTEGHTGRLSIARPQRGEARATGVELGPAREQGADADDVGSIGPAYDTAFGAAFDTWADDSGAQDSGRVVEMVGTAIGEHLVRHRAREWALVTDVFGTDLGLVAAQAETRSRRPG